MGILTVELGDRVKDKISGLKGIVIGITHWLYGCRRLTLQPEENKDGRPAESFTVDEPQVDIIKKRVVEGFGNKEFKEEDERPHGNRSDVQVRHSNPSRR